MQLILQPDEAQVLRAVLAQYLPDLRMEIAGTEKYELRQDLHHTEEVLKAVIARLDQLQAPNIAAEGLVGHHTQHPFVQRPGD